MRKAQTPTRLAYLRKTFLYIHSLWNGSSKLRLTSKFLVLFALSFAVAFHKLDPDFGWHLTTGDYVRAHGIPAHDIFTYTARQFPWIDHEWGNDVVISLLYGFGGYGLVAALFSLLWTGALIIAAERSRLSVLVLAEVALFPYLGVRAIAWTMLFLAVTLYVLKSKRRRLIWLLPLLFMVWANMHAGFVIGLAVIVYYGLYERRPALFSVAALSGLATLVNGYGPRLYVEIARTLFDPTLHSQVAEWRPFALTWGEIVFLVVWGVGGISVEGRAIRPWLRPSIPLLLGAISAARNVPLFIIVAAEECGRYVDVLAAQLRKAARLYRPARWFALGITYLVAMAIMSAGWSHVWPLNTDREATYPRAAVAYLTAEGCENGNIFNDYDYGGYLIWKLPSQPVFIDGRMPSWKAPDGQKYMTEYYTLLDHPSLYRTVFGRYKIRCALLEHAPRNVKLIALLRNNGWLVAIDTKDSVLLMSPR